MAYESQLFLSILLCASGGVVIQHLLVGISSSSFIYLFIFLILSLFSFSFLFCPVFLLKFSTYYFIFWNNNYNNLWGGNKKRKKKKEKKREFPFFLRNQAIVNVWGSSLTKSQPSHVTPTSIFQHPQTTLLLDPFYYLLRKILIKLFGYDYCAIDWWIREVNKISFYF